ncbi:MAG: tol-pal system protein YbgF [Alphaproteobacteria bacterium]|nr:tol-pal system protein YbgF [Alphaproteobacteria bacterium]
MKKMFYVLSFAVSTGVAFSAFAQDFSGFQNQIDDIKEELVVINRKLYRDKTDSAVGVGSSGVAHLGEYDEIIRNLNGKIEELEFKLKQTNERIDALGKDMETRFNMLEGKPIAAATGSLSQTQRFAPTVATGAPRSIVGDEVTSGALNDLGGGVSDVSDLYTQGLEALKLGDTGLAEQNFQLILTNHPSDKLASNAQYWLGEVYYKEKDYAKAAVAFKKGYENYKGGNKGADCLYKLGLSMAQLGKKDGACAAFRELPKEFANASADLKQKAKNQLTQLGCR